MSRNLRAGLIGFGMMGRNHARVLSNLEGVDFVGIVDIDSSSITDANNRPTFSNLAELVRMRIDYAVVAVPTIFHLEVGRELAELGIHTLIEKPLAQNVLASRELLRCFSDANLVSAVGHIERYNPAIQEAKKRLHDLGTIHQIVTRRQGPFPSRVSDIGVIMDLATHDIDTVSWISSQQYEEVTARTVKKSGRDHEDLLVAIALLKNGTPISHLVNWLSPSKERLTVITGEGGTLTVDTLNSDLTFHANGNITSSWNEMANFRGLTEGLMTRYAIPKHEPLRTEHENFRNAVLGKESDIVTLEQGFQNVLIAEAMQASSLTNETIRIKY
jgi:UDP-N-acetylglucosamine 3-dehydrogenase